MVIGKYGAVERYVNGSRYRKGYFYYTTWHPRVTVDTMERHGIRVISIKDIGKPYKRIKFRLPLYVSQKEKRRFIAKRKLEERLAREHLAEELNARGIECTPENSIELFHSLPIGLLLIADDIYNSKHEGLTYEEVIRIKTKK